MAEEVKIKGVQPEDICEIKVSGSFMQRIQGAYFSYVKHIGVDNMNKMTPHLKDNTIGDIVDPELKDAAYSVQTFLTLLQEIEYRFDEMKLIKDIPVDMDSISED